jgi:hypothetical protein
MNTNIWVDSENYMGRGIAGEYASEVDSIPGPENKMVLPCTTCPNYDDCATTGKECSAFRSWCTSGTYDVVKIMKLLK